MSAIQPRGRNYENQLVGLFGLASGVCAMDVQAPLYLMPFIVPEMHINNLQVGLVGMAGLVGWSLAGMAAGPLVDRIGRRRPVLIAAFVCFSLFSLASAVATTFAIFLFARLLVGMTEGPVIPVTQSIVLFESSPHRRGLNMGIAQNTGAQLFGSFLAPILLVWIAKDHGWRAAFLVAAIPGLIIAAAIAWFVREPALPVQRVREPWLRQVAQILAYRNVRLCVMIGSCVLAWYFLLLSFLPIYMTQTLHISTTVMSRVISIFGLAGIIASILVPGLSDRIGRRPAIAIFTGLSAVCSVGMVFAGGNVAAFSVLLFFACLSSGTISVFMATIPLETVEVRHAAAATGLVMALSQLIGGLTAPPAAGYLADHVGLTSVLWVSAGLSVVATIVALFLRPAISPSLRHPPTIPAQ